MRTRNIYLHYFAIALQGQLRQRSSMYMIAFGQLSATLMSFAALALLFGRFGTLAGFGMMEVLLCFGVIHTGFSLAEMLARGFDTFSQILSRGEFDRMMVRPRNLILQVLGSRVELSRVGRLVVGITCLSLVIPALGPQWASFQPELAGLRLCTVFLMVAGSAALFFGIFCMGASLAFVTTDSLEVVNILTDGGRELSQYPLTIYDPWIRRFFTVVVPFGCVNYLPLEFVLARPGAQSWTCMLPLAGLAFLALGIALWYGGARRYASTGS